MTYRTARLRGHRVGWVLHCRANSLLAGYLADYRETPMRNTHDQNEAEFFARLIDAEEMARRVRHLTGYSYDLVAVGSTVPADAPRVGCDCGGLCEPCTGSDRVRLSDGRTLEVTVDELAAENALIDAAADFHLPLDAPTYVLGQDD